MSLLVKGRDIPPPIDESIRLFNLAQAFSFKHLPEPGGLYQQHPDILDRFLYILSEQQKQQKQEDKERERKQSRGGRRIAGR